MQHGVGHVNIPFLYHPTGKAYGSEAKDLLQNPSSIAGAKNGFLCKVWYFCKFFNWTMIINK